MSDTKLSRQSTLNLRLTNSIFNNLSEQEKVELLLDVNMEVIYLSTLRGPIFGSQYFDKLLKDNTDFARWLDQKKKSNLSYDGLTQLGRVHRSKSNTEATQGQNHG